MAKKTAKSRPRTPDPTFRLSGLERMLLVLYHAVPVAVRADVGRRLFHAWTHPSPESERGPNELRWNAAVARFKAGSLGVNVFDDVQAGEVIDGGAR